MKNVHNPVERGTKTNKIFILELHQCCVHPVVYTSRNKEKRKENESDMINMIV